MVSNSYEGGKALIIRLSQNYEMKKSINGLKVIAMRLIMGLKKSHNFGEKKL